MFVGVDIETTGLYPVPGSKIFCCAVNDGKSIKVYTDWREIKALLENPAVCKIFQNATFDLFWLLRLWGINVTNVWDTMLCELILIGENLSQKETDPDTIARLATKLDIILERYGLAKIKTTLTGKHWTTRPLNAPLTAVELDYVKDDVKYLLKLQAMQQYRLEKLNLMRVATLENKLVEVTVAMRNRGIRFDSKIWLKTAVINREAFNAILKRLPATVQNWNSPKQVTKYFQSRGIPMVSMEEKETKKLYAKYNDPVLAKFIELRSYFKNVTTYGASWLEDDIKITTVDLDGRIRSDFYQLVDSGRYSSSHPNLQNVPVKGNFLASFVPSRGKVFIRGDFGGQEIGIMAAASKEDVWIKAMLRREDIHSLTASLMYAEEWRKGTEKRCTFPKKCECKVHLDKRRQAKILNFSIAYGAKSENISEQLKVTVREAYKILHRYNRVVPRLIRWLGKNADTTEKTRISYSADVYKRRRILYSEPKWRLRNIGKNNPVQACGANMLKLSLISLKASTPVVLVIHDEIVLEVEKKHAKKYCKELKIIMEKAADYCTGIPGLIEVYPQIATNLLKE